MGSRLYLKDGVEVIMDSLRQWTHPRNCEKDGLYQTSVIKSVYKSAVTYCSLHRVSKNTQKVFCASISVLMAWFRIWILPWWDRNTSSLCLCNSIIVFTIHKGKIIISTANEQSRPKQHNGLWKWIDEWKLLSRNGRQVTNVKSG